MMKGKNNMDDRPVEPMAVPGTNTPWMPSLRTAVKAFPSGRGHTGMRIAPAMPAVLLVTALALFYSPRTQAEPVELTKLRHRYDFAVSIATQLVDKRFGTDLKALKLKFEASGNTGAAAAVQGKIDALPASEGDDATADDAATGPAEQQDQAGAPEPAQGDWKEVRRQIYEDVDKTVATELASTNGKCGPFAKAVQTAFKLELPLAKPRRPPKAIETDAKDLTDKEIAKLYDPEKMKAAAEAKYPALKIGDPLEVKLLRGNVVKGKIMAFDDARVKIGYTTVSIADLPEYVARRLKPELLAEDIKNEMRRTAVQERYDRQVAYDQNLETLMLDDNGYAAMPIKAEIQWVDRETFFEKNLRDLIAAALFTRRGYALWGKEWTPVDVVNEYRFQQGLKRIEVQGDVDVAINQQNQEANLAALAMGLSHDLEVKRLELKEKRLAAFKHGVLVVRETRTGTSSGTGPEAIRPFVPGESSRSAPVPAATTSITPDAPRPSSGPKAEQCWRCWGRGENQNQKCTVCKGTGTIYK